MTIDEMFNELENKVRDTYIVTLKYKYDFEKDYTIENQILEYDSMNYVWLDDWYEGQTDVEVLGYMILGDVDTAKLEPCEDCISRAEVFETYSVLYDVFDDNPNICNELHKIFVKLNKLPSVTPKQKVGKWLDILDEKTENTETHHDECSNCGYHGWTEYSYCPNCGAKMEGEKDGSD